MDIEIFTFCWNEIDILPWVVDYWKRFATHVTVFDNGSTDGSVEYLEKFRFVTVKHFNTDGLNDIVHQKIKNECWKGSKADFVVVCDMDEILCAKDIRRQLEEMLFSGATICKPTCYVLFSDEYPKYDGKLLHEVRPMGVIDNTSKTILFDPKKITAINYTPGAHRCRPEGEVRWYDGKIYMFHINHNLSFDYKIRKYRELDARRSEDNIRKKHGIHYAFSKDVLREAWENDRSKAVDFCQILNR